MVNWKMLGIAGLAYLASWQCSELNNSNKGYNELERGLSEGDKGLRYTIEETARPMSDKLQELFHTNGLRYRDDWLQKHQYKIQEKADDVAGYGQIASILLAGLGIVGAGKRKKINKK